MLKWFFLLLVVVNLGVYLWGVQKENARQSQEIIATPGMGNLRMISELEKGDELPVAQNSPSTADSAPVPSQPEPAVVAKVDQPKSPAPAAPPTKEVVTPAAPDHVETSDSLLLQQNIADTEAKHFDLTTNQELIADAAVIHAPQPVVAEETEAQREPVTQAPPQQFCGSIGPEEDHAQMSKLQSILTRQGIEAVLREEDLEKTVGYWVMVPPLESKEAAVALILRLRKEGIKDIRRFNKGEEKNG
ncbi:MAG: hypothetical protein MI754_12970, partial [Chromatiales bacterium]|nr:hypothetical protein [Chromatiales bacterium]